MGQDARRFARVQRAKLHLGRTTHGGIHKDDSIRVGHRFRQLRRQERASQALDGREAERGHRFRHPRAHPIVPPQRVPVTDHQKH